MDRMAPMVESFRVILGTTSPPIDDTGTASLQELRAEGGSYFEDNGHRVLSSPNTERGRFLFDWLVRTYPPETADLVIVPRAPNQGVMSYPFVRRGFIPIGRLEAILDQYAGVSLSQLEVHTKAESWLTQVAEVSDPITRIALLDWMTRTAERQLQKDLQDIGSAPTKTPSMLPISETAS